MDERNPFASLKKAPDVCWNAPFKNAIREKYNDWMVNGEKPTTSTGNLKAPPMDIYLEWIASAWESIPKPLIEDSFLTCGITKEIDGRHDEKIHVFKKDGAIPNGLALLKQRRKEDAVIKGVEEIDLGEDESDASAFLCATDSSVSYKIDFEVPTPPIEPFELMNERTKEKLTLKNVSSLVNILKRKDFLQKAAIEGAKAFGVLADHKIMVN
ncbi:hypothetical protein niasHT_024131 [Heterodera trifolii]|uniref:DDE-1 domain-containing protein n=1 Tax=Heterodera trifolii TaxID=157864 RepID=A0ABD2KRA0_9BILA